MLVAERYKQILQILNERGSARVSELSQICGVTEETIRKDLDNLEVEGKLRRIHGGAVSTHKQQSEIPYNQREVKNVKEKRMIANEAIKHIQSNNRIILDASTTAWYTAKALPNIPLTVMTNSIKVALELSQKSNIDVISTGGTLSTRSLSYRGPLAERSLEPYHFDKVFISCQGIDIPNGISESNEMQARLKRKMIQSADEVYLLVDHTKFGVQAFTHMADWLDIQHVITDSGIDPESLNKLHRSHVKLYVV